MSRGSHRESQMVAPWFRVGVASAACSGSLTQSAAADTPAGTDSVSTPARSLPDFAALAERYGPAVVNVAIVGKSQTVSDSPGGGGPNDPFGEFFRRFGQP